MKIIAASLMCALLVACGGDDDGSGDAPDAMVSAPDADPGAPDAEPRGIDASVVPFELTSTAFANGQRFPDAHTCGGANDSPPLAWTPGPPGTLSYAIVFTDITTNFLHSSIWDIPANVTSLPENVENVAEPSVPAGSKQSLGFNGVTRGYLGPCPGSEHTYEFVIYAIDSATLPTVNLQSSIGQVKAAAEANDLGMASLQGTWGP